MREARSAKKGTALGSLGGLCAHQLAHLREGAIQKGQEEAGLQRQGGQQSLGIGGEGLTHAAVAQAKRREGEQDGARQAVTVAELAVERHGHLVAYERLIRLSQPVGQVSHA